MPSASLPVGVASLVVLAGCLAPAPGSEPGTGGLEPASDPLEAKRAPSLRSLMADVPCEVAQAVTGPSDNLLRLAELRYAEPGKRHGELDLGEGLAVISTFDAQGFDLVSIRDPLVPKVLAEWSGARGKVYDVKLAADRSTVFVGVGRGIDIVDVRQPEDPHKTGEWNWPARITAFTNAHMLYLYTIDETTYLFVAPNDNSGVWILRVLGEPGAHELEYVAQAAAHLNGPLGPHDIWVTHDEDLDAHVLYVANGFLGWLAYDASNPTAPTLLGGTPNPDSHQGYIHTIQAAKVGDRRLVATISEVGVNAMRVYDATNLRAPVLLGSWTLESTNPTLYQHNLQMVDGFLFVAHYEHGVFVFDLEALPQLPYTGFQGLRPMAHFDGNNVWDVALRDGLVYVGDWDRLHVVGFGCLKPGDPRLSSTG